MLLTVTKCQCQLFCLSADPHNEVASAHLELVTGFYWMVTSGAHLELIQLLAVLLTQSPFILGLAGVVQ